jgi:hypothetical protein
MKMKIRSWWTMALLFTSCTSGKDEQISGIYVHERAYEQKNINTEKVIGNVAVRDSILITKKELGYQIENRVWKSRDYNRDGWQRSYEAAMKTHAVTYDMTDQSLNTEMSLYNPMYLDFEKGQLYFSKDSESKWTKVN